MYTISYTTSYLDISYTTSYTTSYLAISYTIYDIVHDIVYDIVPYDVVNDVVYDVVWFRDHMVICTRLVVSNGNLICLTGDPRRDAIHSTSSAIVFGIKPSGSTAKSYTISTYDIGYDIQFQTYDIVGFR